MEEYPYDRDSFFVQEHDFPNSIDDILKEAQDEVPFDSRDVIHHESSCMDGRWSDSTHDQSYIQSYDPFADDLVFSHADGSSIQPRLPKVDETVTSRKPATTLACAWPDCKVSTKRKTDLIRHINTRHFPAHRFPCQVSGCNRSFYRKDKLQEHERHSHHSEVLVSQRDVSKTTTQAVNDVLAPHDDESICLSTKDTILDESGSRSLGWWKFDLPDFDLDPQRSTPATEDSGGPSDDLSRTSDGLSRRGSLSTKSTSSYRTISSRNLSELRSASQVRGLACPFRKHNRQEYAIHKYKSCATSKWATVHRVKEHLYRCHRVLQCRRCWTIFKNQEGLQNHLGALEICEIQLGSPAEGITPEIERQLKVRRKLGGDSTEEDRWKEMYSLLFPHKIIPSPYFEFIEDVCLTENFTSREASIFELDGLKNTNSVDLKDLASYVREELPGVINLQLDAAFGKKGAPRLDDQQKSELMLIITECHDLIVKKYQERIAGGEEMRSLSTGDDVGSVSTGSRVVLESQDIDMDSGQAEDENHFTF